MRAFTRVAEAGSFSRVARELGASQPTISRQVALLEEHLGCLLLRRTTRSLSLTDDGRVFLAHAKRTLESVDEAESAVGRRRGRPSGTLRLAAPVVLARLHIVPRLAEFLERFPDIEVDLMLADHFSNVAGEGIDLAVRVGDIQDPTLIARGLGVSRRVVVASPDYLARRGRPRELDDLTAHDCVVYSRLATGHNWRFVVDGTPRSVPIRGRVAVDATEGVRAAVLAGLGIGYVPAWHFTDGEIETGRLTRLFAGHESSPQPISAVYLTRRHLAPKVRAMIDYLVESFASDPIFAAP